MTTTIANSSSVPALRASGGTPGEHGGAGGPHTPQPRAGGLTSPRMSRTQRTYAAATVRVRGNAGQGAGAASRVWEGSYCSWERQLPSGCGGPRRSRWLGPCGVWEPPSVEWAFWYNHGGKDVYRGQEEKPPLGLHRGDGGIVSESSMLWWEGNL